MNISIHCKHPKVIIGKCPITEDYIRFIRTTKQLNNKTKNQVVELALKYKKIPILVPCGECEQCRWEKQKQWMSRLNMETSIAIRDGWKCFYSTLTINPEHYPEVDNTENCKKWYANNFAHFLARLRAQRGGRLKFRYFASCEYGDHYGRFHIHCAFFVKNFDVVPDVSKLYFPYKVCVGKRRDGKTRLQTVDEVNFHHFLERYWGYGFVEKVSYLNLSTSMYITKYISKVKQDKLHDKIPFHRQSLGLGIQWIRDHEYEVATGIAKLSPCAIDNDKYHFKIPRYYRVKCQRKYGTYYSNAVDFAKKSWDICIESIRQTVGNKPFRSDIIAVPNKYNNAYRILHSLDDLGTASIHLEYNDDGSIEDVVLVDDEFSGHYYVGNYADMFELLDVYEEPDMPSDEQLELWLKDLELQKQNKNLTLNWGVFEDAPVENLYENAKSV